jgi:FtsZ-interacting cell division protein YlmF
MASLWNKTLFYLGLVDEESQGAEQVEGVAGEVTQLPASTPTVPPTPQTSTSSVLPPGSGVSGRRVEPPLSTKRQMSSDPQYAEAGVYVHRAAGAGTGFENVARRSEPESQIIVARNFSDAQMLADAIRGGRAVVLDLRGSEPAMVRRIVDFASGLTYALDGKMAKTAQGVIFVSPSGVTLGVAEQERLATLGLYETTH